jgi:DNA-binding NarL/FixJ family response regulator
MINTATRTHRVIEEADYRTVLLAIEERHVEARIVAALRQDPLRVVSVASLDEIAPDAASDLLVLYWHEVTAARLVLLRDVRREHDQLPTVVICAPADVKGARRVVSGGVEGLVLADRIDTALVPTIHAVLAGQAVVPANLKGDVRKAALTFREKQILGLVALGLTNGQIASWMFLSESTVKSHLSSGFTKLGVRSRSEAAAVILDPHETLGAGILKIAEQLRAARFGPVDEPYQDPAGSPRLASRRPYFAHA